MGESHQRETDERQRGLDGYEKLPAIKNIREHSGWNRQEEGG